jgi:hypothetical protein
MAKVIRLYALPTLGRRVSRIGLSVRENGVVGNGLARLFGQGGDAFLQRLPFGARESLEARSTSPGSCLFRNASTSCRLSRKRR